MKRWSWVVTVLVLAGLIALPAYGEMRLKVTGYIDNHIGVIQNISTNEEDPGNGDLTRDDDLSARARTRGRIFFHIAANDFSKAVFGFEIDQVWGDDTGKGSGFDLGNDNKVVEVKWLYIDVKIPSTPVRFQMGGFSFNGDRLKRCLMFCDDGGGIAIHTNFSPQVKNYTYYFIAEEELIENGLDTLGEDWGIGNTLMLTPVKGVDLHLLVAFYNIEAPSSDSSSLMIGSCSTGRDGGAGAVGAHCFDRDTRVYLGIDARVRLGNFTFSPTFIYLAGTRKLAGPGDDPEADLRAFLLDVRGAYRQGPFTITGKFVLIPGNEASDDLGSGSDLHFWQNISVTTVNRTVHWFELMGWNLDSTSAPPFGFNNSRAMRSAGTFDQFGLIHGAIKLDYKIAKPWTFTTAVGFFMAEDDVGAPARFGGAVPNTYNWTGNDKYLGTEIDAVLKWNAFKGTTVQIWFAYAAIGDAQNLCATGTGGTTGVACSVLDAKDQVGGGGRMIYRF